MSIGSYPASCYLQIITRIWFQRCVCECDFKNSILFGVGEASLQTSCQFTYYILLLGFSLTMHCLTSSTLISTFDPTFSCCESVTHPVFKSFLLEFEDGSSEFSHSPRCSIEPPLLPPHPWMPLLSP